MVAPLPTRRAFTLTELLVTVAILGVLTLISLPIVSTALDRSKAAQCQSNLRQIGVAINLFAADRNGYYPYWGGASDPVNGAWYTQLSGYGLAHSANSTVLSSILYCPYSGKDGTGGWPAHNPDYGINLAVTNFLGTPTKRAQVLDPTGTALMVETKGTESIFRGDFRFNPYWYGLLNSGPQANGSSIGNGGMVFRHPRPASEGDMSGATGHVLFCDGHVEAVKFNDERFQDRQKRNSLFLPDYR